MNIAVKHVCCLLVGAGVLGLAGCSKVEREAEFRDGNALLKEKSHLFLLSRDAAETLSVTSYQQTIQALASDNKLDAASPEDMALLKSVAEPIIEQAKRMYPHSRNWQWEYHLANDPSMNAMCYAGGKILVLSGLLDGIGRDRDKLAVVLGHEVSHALLEHSRASMSRDWALTSGMWIVAKSFKMGMTRFSTALGDMQTAFLPMTRNQEREADVLGLELMARSGFDPKQGILLWEDFMRQHSGRSEGAKRLETFLSDHPTDEDRLNKLTQLAARLEPLKGQGAKP